MAAAQNNSTLVVFGATGKQGGSVARAAAKSGRFSNVRLITRNVENAKAKESLAELQKLAAGRTKLELVAATFDDKASLDAALAGADYLFFVTNWWELFAANGGAPGEAGFVAGKKAGEIELTQGKNVIDAAKKAGIKFTVFSGLEDSRKSGFKNIYHFHYKGEIEEYMWANVAGATVRLAFYLENFGGMFSLRDGALAMPIPDDAPFPMVAVDEMGAIVDGVFKQVVEYGPAYWDKEAIGAANGAVTGKEIAALWAKAAGKPVTFQSVPAATYANFGFPGDAELAEMFQFQLDEKNCRRDSALSRALATDRLSTVAEWFAANSATLKF